MNDASERPTAPAPSLRFVKRLPAAMLVVGLAAAILAVWFFRSNPKPPADVDTLEADVQPLGLTPVRVGPGSVYLCDRPREVADLYRLMRTPAHTDQWEGLVYAEYAPPVDALDDPTTHDWGSHGLRVVGCILFGDPRLLAKIGARFAR